ncbi:MAG: FtsQ-type POTRA domain-containing protein [Clostridia bacterium]|nr:FtsQ-type POTRA domain-containing protein [Clostridia bacterium]
MAQDRRKTDEERTHEREERLAAKEKLATQRTYFLIAMLVLIVIFVVGSVIMWVRIPRTDEEGRPLATGGPFSVETLTLEGNSMYAEDAVLHTSGVVVGQSIFNVDAEEIEQELMTTYPYYSSVKVETLGMKEVKITVTETSVIGVMYADGAWVLIGENGKAVSKKEVTTNRPKGVLYVKGAKLPEGGVRLGGQAMEDYSFEVLQALVAAINDRNLTDIIEIDLTDLSDIRMNWRGQIEVKLGNSSNLQHEIAVVADNIPRILRARGDHITGVLNVSSYSNDMLTDQAIFTPSSVLNPSVIGQPSTNEEDE